MAGRAREGKANEEAGVSKPICVGRLTALGLLLLLLCATPVLANDDKNDAASPAHPTGLMWNRTGLPAVFPLQVKTSAGRDYFLTLTDDETGEDALAAYIEGGSFFKVLVPPGVFRLKFAAGNGWQGETDLFGPGADTRIFELKAPLTFEVRSLGIKAGHLVDITDRSLGNDAQAAVKDQSICQRIRAEFPSPAYPFPDGNAPGYAGHFGWRGTGDGHLTYPREGPLGKAPDRRHFDYHFRAPRHVTWSQYCGQE